LWGGVWIHSKFEVKNHNDLHETKAHLRVYFFNNGFGGLTSLPDASEVAENNEKKRFARCTPYGTYKFGGV
jgi:hypothetical protein